MSQPEHDSPHRPVADSQVEQEHDRREFLHRAALAAGAAVVGSGVNSFAGAQPVLRATNVPVLLDSTVIQARLAGTADTQRRARELAQSAMLVRGLELVNTFNPNAVASFDLSFTLKW